jgi:pilus assembly protein Flp/PilA
MFLVETATSSRRWTPWDSTVRKYLRLIRFTPSRRQRAVARLAYRAFREDHGGEVLEYALVAGLIVVGSIATIGCVGGKVLARWRSVNSGL